MWISIRARVFIHITKGYNDPYWVSMPIKMAAIRAKDKNVR
jgi:hypothetical protein